MVVLGIIRWVVLGLFLIFLYFAEFKKKEQFHTPAQIALLLGVLLHAILRDWHIVLRVIIILIALIGLVGTIFGMFKKEERRVV